MERFKNNYFSKLDITWGLGAELLFASGHPNIPH